MGSRLDFYRGVNGLGDSEPGRLINRSGFPETQQESSGYTFNALPHPLPAGWQLKQVTEVI